MENNSDKILGSTQFNTEVGLHSQIDKKLQLIRAELAVDFPFIHRIAVAVYDEDRDALHTYAFDEDSPSNIHNYEAILSECTSLLGLANSSTDRVVNDMTIFDKSIHRHTHLINKVGFYSSYTAPLIIDGKLLGFFFANSRDKNVLKGEVINRLKLNAMLVALWLQQDDYRFNVLKSTVESMKIVSDHRDPETGEHLLRMASYSLLIARDVADLHQLNDIEIDQIYLYSSLHDIGKITIADSILLKPGKLTEDEFDAMKLHTTKGDEIATKLIELYDLKDIPYIEMLSNIIRSHHEKMDGSGYPDGLMADEIPIEARIIAVADIFDALTSQRPYKKAWSNAEAFKELKQLSGTKLDSSCVEALCRNTKQILEIQQTFIDFQHVNESEQAKTTTIQCAQKISANFEVF